MVEGRLDVFVHHPPPLPHLPPARPLHFVPPQILPLYQLGFCSHILPLFNLLSWCSLFLSSSHQETDKQVLFHPTHVPILCLCSNSVLFQLKAAGKDYLGSHQSILDHICAVELKSNLGDVDGRVVSAQLAPMEKQLRKTWASTNGKAAQHQAANICVGEYESYYHSIMWLILLYGAAGLVNCWVGDSWSTL